MQSAQNVLIPSVRLIPCCFCFAFHRNDCEGPLGSGKKSCMEHELHNSMLVEQVKVEIPVTWGLTLCC